MAIHFQRRLINSLKGRLIACMFVIYCGCSVGEASYQNASCPDSSWLLFRCSCYFYQHSEPNIDWETAVTRCSGRQAHLVDIRDLDEWEFVRKNAHSSVWQYRMGMTDQATEGVWRFQDGSTVNFTKWAPPDEPNGGEKENCATFFGDTAKLGLYNDGPCTYRYNAYVCKKDAVAGPNHSCYTSAVVSVAPLSTPTPSQPIATTPPSKIFFTDRVEAIAEGIGSTTSCYRTCVPKHTRPSSTSVPFPVQFVPSEIFPYRFAVRPTTSTTPATSEPKTRTPCLSTSLTAGLMEPTSEQTVVLVPTRLRPSSTPASIAAPSVNRKPNRSIPPPWVVPVAIVVCLVVLLVFLVVGICLWRRKRHHSSNLPSSKIPLSNVN